MSELIEIMDPIIEITVEKLKNKKFKSDPIAGEHFSKIVSVMSSAYKRHGFIIERAILERLKTNTNFEVWEDRSFNVPIIADHLVDSAIENPELIFESETSYVEGPRTLQIDVIVYNKINKQISAYEIKRGNRLHDSGKRRLILRDILCTKFYLNPMENKKVSKFYLPKVI